MEVLFVRFVITIASSMDVISVVILYCDHEKAKYNKLIVDVGEWHTNINTNENTIEWHNSK